MLHGLRRRGNEAITLTQVAAQDADLIGRPKAPAQQPVCVQLLQPLTVARICLAPWHLFEMLRIDQLDVKAPLFEHFKEADPVDPGRLHRHRLDATLREPGCQGIEVDNGNGYSREQRMADDTVNAFYSIR
jgi:hypothetical protein